MIRAWVIVAALALSQPYQTTSHVLIAQQPSSARAVRCTPPPRGEFAAGCSSFTSSTANVLFPTRPAASVQFRVEMTAHDPGDAVRLRAFRWVPPASAGAPWTVEDEYWTALAPVAPDGSPLYGQPRSVGEYLSPSWWNSRDGQWTFVLEMRGSPTIYGAQVIEISDLK